MEAEEKKLILKSCKLHPAKLDVALAQTVRPQKLRSFNFRPKFPLLSYQDIVKIKVLGKCLPNCFQLVGKKMLLQLELADQVCLESSTNKFTLSQLQN